MMLCVDIKTWKLIHLLQNAKEGDVICLYKSMFWVGFPAIFQQYQQKKVGWHWPELAHTEFPSFLRLIVGGWEWQRLLLDSLHILDSRPGPSFLVNEGLVFCQNIYDSIVTKTKLSGSSKAGAQKRCPVGFVFNCFINTATLKRACSLCMAFGWP